jgi:acyl-coenzyme A thioesterase PaaI-like protein
MLAFDMSTSVQPQLADAAALAGGVTLADVAALVAGVALADAAVSVAGVALAIHRSRDLPCCLRCEGRLSELRMRMRARKG